MSGANDLQYEDTILLAEDEVMIRIATADILRDEGFKVVEAGNGAEAWRLVEASPRIDLVITDIRMPGEPDGLELAAMVKASRPALPVMILTSYYADETDRRFDEILMKPVLPARLIKVVKELVDTECKGTDSTRSASS